MSTSTITGRNISEGNVIDFRGYPAEYRGMTITVEVGTVDYVEIADGLGGPGAYVIPEGQTFAVYVEIHEQDNYKILG